MSRPEKNQHSFLSGGGEMGAIIRAYDWDNSPLGPPEFWSQSLKTALRILLSTGHPMFIWWGNDLIQFYNDAYRRSIGPERHPSAIGQRGRECWDEIWDIIGPQVEQVMAGKGFTWHENQLVPITRYGKREDVYWTYSYGPIDDPDARNGVGGVLVVCTETTEQVLSEKRMQAADARWRSLFNQAPGFMCILHGPEHVFEFANPRYIELVGGRSIIGKTIRAALPEVVEQGFADLLDQVYRTGEPYSATATLVTLKEQGSVGTHDVYLDFVYQPIRDAADKVTGILVDGYDVTERIRSSELLREEGRRKDEFLAMLAHELRNPLAPIQNASELLLRMAEPDSKTEVIGNILLRQSSQLTSMVDDLLDMSRITRGLIKLAKAPMELDKAVAMAIESVRPQLDEKRHELSYENAADELYIYGDSTRITQCIANLLSNAIKYTSPGGKIRLALTAADDDVMITVADNGIGLAAEMLPKVFDLFVQADHGLDRSHGGLGIGLSIVRRLVNMHDGIITAHSQGRGCGSSFQIRLPRMAAPAAASPTPAAERLARKSLLIVDDNIDAADSLAELLRLNGHETAVAYNGRDALARLDARPANIVLLDIGLPGMNGYEVAEQARKSGYDGLLIALSGYGQAGDIERSHQAGFDAHLTKPVTLAELERVIHKHTGPLMAAN